MTQLIIDADAHLTEPADVWTARVPAKHLEHVPQVVRGDDGRDTWVIDGAVRAGSFLVKMLSFPMCIMQSGRVQGYAFFVVIGVLVFFGYYVVR